MTATRGWPVLLALVVMLLGCSTAVEPLTITSQEDDLDADGLAAAEWTDPVNLGPVINSSASDANATLSPDELTLYFASNRAGSLGATDIWASHRQCKTCAWETPFDLGAPINTAAPEGAPTLSEDGRMLFFFSARPDSIGGSIDIYVSHRVSTNADGDVWGDPVNLGPDVNTALVEQGSYFTREGGGRNAALYFNRLSPTGNLDIYRVEISRDDGLPVGPAVAVSELNDPVAADQKVTVRRDGLELLLSSTRAGTLGGFDIWRSTRRTVREPWSTPENIGAPVNTKDVDSQPHLSRDGRTLILTSTRAGGFGGNDLWMSTRRPRHR